MAQWVKNPATGTLIPSLAQCVIGSVVATDGAWNQSLAWDLPYAMGAAMKRRKIKG